jgi:prepilin-type processing-associated H-X9-DG protein
MQRSILRRRQAGAAGFSMVQLVVVIVLGLVLIGFLLPTIHQTNHGGCSNRVKCVANLKQIGNALLLYANENRGAFPRTHWVNGAPVRITNDGFADVNPFVLTPEGNKINNIPQAMFLLIRAEWLTPSVFVCPSSFTEADDYGGQPVSTRSNFTGTGTAGGEVTKNCSYSFINVYPTTTARKLGYKELVADFSSDVAVAADISPAAIDSPVWAAIKTGVPRATIMKGNSPNHDGIGQNVLFADGHADFMQTPLCGVNGDNIYTPQDITATKADECVSAQGNDPAPRSATDAVLLIHTP